MRIALARSSWVRIRYRAAGGNITERLVKPQQISGTCLVAWCDLRDDRRTFRLDRIEKAELVD
ncbi:MAG: WYL domain-containing protein [Planctomycetota bacterium]